MRRYNLVDEKWIPVRMHDGSYEEFGIAETLLRAKEIVSIEDPSPLVVAAIHRFLLAVLYRAFKGPTDFDQARDLFNEGFPNEKITAYLERWYDRFWLFDDKYPFFQIQSLSIKKKSSWSALFNEFNANNAKVLFDHSNIKLPDKMSIKMIARGVLAIQTFALPGGVTELKNRRAAPSAMSVMVLPMGINLEETLIFSLVEQNREIQTLDYSIWEREPESITDLKRESPRPLYGYADLYTWRSRSMRLIMEHENAVERLDFASGIKNNKSDFIDPMVPYRRDNKYGMLPIQFGERGMWRQYDSLLPDSLGYAPKNVNHAVKLSKLYPNRRLQSILVLGQAGEQGKVDFWRMERFVLPREIMEEKTSRSDIKRLLDFAEDSQKILWAVCRAFALEMLSHGDRSIEKKDILSFVKQMACERSYWSQLEAKFHDILGSYSQDKDPEEIEEEWLLAVRQGLFGAWNQYKLSISLNNVWAIRALVKADQVLMKRFSKTFKTNNQFSSKEGK